MKCKKEGRYWIVEADVLKSPLEMGFRGVLLYVQGMRSR
jgi:hypothetical protein